MTVCCKCLPAGNPPDFQGVASCQEPNGARLKNTICLEKGGNGWEMGRTNNTSKKQCANLLAAVLLGLPDGFLEPALSDPRGTERD